MYEVFEVKNFRCFDGLRLEELARINLVCGKNDVGKTSLLEAIWAHHGYVSDRHFLMQRWRGVTAFERKELLSDVYHELRTASPIKTESVADDGHRRIKSVYQEEPGVEEIPFPPSGGRGEVNSAPEGQNPSASGAGRSESGEGYEGLSAKQIRIETEDDVRGAYTQKIRLTDRGLAVEGDRAPEVAKAILLRPDNLVSSEVQNRRFTSIVDADYKDKLIEILKIIDERVTDFQILSRSNQPYVHAFIGLKRALPVGLLGAGFRGLFNMAISFIEAENGVLLIDEFENGLHYSILSDVWRAVERLSDDFGVQVFVTTHSYECVAAMQQVLGQAPNENYRLIRLDREGAEIRSVPYEPDELAMALQEDWEVRG